MTQVSSNETHISAQQDKACPHPRFSRTHGHQSRAPRVEAPPRKRPRAVDAVTNSASAATTGDKPGLTSSRGIRFQKDNRLLDAAAFGRVFQKATRSRDKLFTVLCRPNEQCTARLGLAVAKKHCRRATKRNHIKRIIRESFRQHQAELAGLDIVVMNRPDATGASNTRLFESLERHWQRCSKALPIPRES